MNTDYARHQNGYTMLALLALMTLMMIAVLAAAPVMVHEAQRQRELETIQRGEQIADAIRAYVIRTNGQLPTTFEQLEEGAPVPGATRKLQVLRSVSQKDLLTEKGEWRMVRLTDMAILRRFCRNVAVYNDNRMPPLFQPNQQGTLPPQFQSINTALQAACPPNMVISGLASLGDGLEVDEGTSSLGSGTGPFIGVMSTSRKDSIISYYGITKHNQWVFTPLFR